MSKQQPARHLAPDDMAAMIDGNLRSDEHAAFVSHLAECEECRESLAEYARAQDALSESTPPFGRSRMVWMSLAATLTLAAVAGVLTLRRQPPAPKVPSAVATPSATPSAASRLPAPPPAVAPAPPREAPEDLTTRRSGRREIGGKTFRLIAGEWIDSAYDPLALLPAEDVDPSARDAVLARIPALRPYAVLGPRFVVVYGGIVYRFGPR